MLRTLTRPRADAGPAAAGHEADIAAEHVRKTFADFKALRDASVTIGKGEMVSFPGPSGCGRTPLLRAIAGLDPATSGRIT